MLTYVQVYRWCDPRLCHTGYRQMYVISVLLQNRLLNVIGAPASTCYDMTSTADYWIENTVSNWNSYMTVFYDAFTTTAFNSSLQVTAIVDAFPINVPDNIPSATAFLNNFGAALGLLGGALGICLFSLPYYLAQTKTDFLQWKIRRYRL
jgi:hypothetical protein